MIEEFHWSEAGYVLTQVATATKPFTPQLFPELKLDLAQLESRAEDCLGNLFVARASCPSA